MRLSLAAVSIISTATTAKVATASTVTTADEKAPNKADRLLKHILSSSSKHNDIQQIKKNKSRNGRGVLDAIRRRHLQRNRQNRVLRNLPTDQEETGHGDQKQQTKLCLVDSSKGGYARNDDGSSSSASSFLGILSCGQNQYCVDAGAEDDGGLPHPFQFFSVGYCVDINNNEEENIIDHNVHRHLEEYNYASPVASPVAAPVASLEASPVAAPVASLEESPVAAPVASLEESPVAAGQGDDVEETIPGRPLVDFPIDLCARYGEAVAEYDATVDVDRQVPLEPLMTCTYCAQSIGGGVVGADGIANYDYYATAYCQTPTPTCREVESFCPNEKAVNACYDTKIDWNIYDYQSYQYEICQGVNTTITNSDQESQSFEYCFGRTRDGPGRPSCTFSVNGEECQSCSVIDDPRVLANGELDYGCMLADCTNVAAISGVDFFGYTCSVNLIESFISAQVYSTLPCTESGGCSLCGREDGTIQNGEATFIYQGNELTCSESQLTALIGQNSDDPSAFCEAARLNATASCGCEFDFPFEAPAPTLEPAPTPAPAPASGSSTLTTGVEQQPTEAVPSGAQSISLNSKVGGSLLITILATHIVSWLG